MLRDALNMSRRARSGDAASLKEEQQARRRADANGFAESGVMGLMGGATTYAGLRRAAAAAAIAAAGMSSSKPAKPDANDPGAVFAASPFREVTKAEFVKQMAVLKPYLTRERACVPSSDFHQWVDVEAMLAHHVLDGRCARCKGSDGGGDSCYIYGSLLEYISHEPRWDDKGTPGKIDCAVIPVAAGAPHDACVKTMATLFKKGIIEPTTLAEAHTLAPAFLVPKSAYLLSAAEAAVVHASLYDIKQIEVLAEQRARRIFADMQARADAQADAGRNPSYTRAIFEAAQARERGEPKWRVVQAFDQAKVNEHTPDWNISMASFGDDFLYNWSTDTHFFKKDLEKGFYAIRVASEFRKFYCFRDPADPARIWRFTRLPMGLKNSPALFSMMTGEFVQMVRATDFVTAQGATAAMYIDDFGGAAKAKVATQYSAKVAALGAEVGLSWAADKDSGPSGAEELLGLTYASNVGGEPMIRVAGAQMFALLVGLHLLLVCHEAAPEHAQVPASFIKSLAGRAGWVAQTTYAARMHVGSLWYCARMAPHTMVPIKGLVENGLLADAAWFVANAKAGTLRGQRTVRSGAFEESNIKRVASDASGAKGQGAGAVCDGKAIYHCWCENEADMSIQAQELHPIVGAARAWGKDWRGKTVIFATDNLGNAIGINSGKAARGAARRLLGELYDLADKHGFELLAVWVPREYNVVCDALSKATSVGQARVMAAAVSASVLSVETY